MEITAIYLQPVRMEPAGIDAVADLCGVLVRAQPFPYPDSSGLQHP